MKSGEMTHILDLARQDRFSSLRIDQFCLLRIELTTTDMSDKADETRQTAAYLLNSLLEALQLKKLLLVHCLEGDLVNSFRFELRLKHENVSPQTVIEAHFADRGEFSRLLFRLTKSVLQR